jgi:hypothetical protein
LAALADIDPVLAARAAEDEDEDEDEAVATPAPAAMTATASTAVLTANTRIPTPVRSVRRSRTGTPAAGPVRFACPPDAPRGYGGSPRAGRLCLDHLYVD